MQDHGLSYHTWHFETDEDRANMHVVKLIPCLNFQESFYCCHYGKDSKQVAASYLAFPMEELQGKLVILFCLVHCVDSWIGFAVDSFME